MSNTQSIKIANTEYVYKINDLHHIYPIKNKSGILKRVSPTGLERRIITLITGQQVAL